MVNRFALLALLAFAALAACTVRPEDARGRFVGQIHAQPLDVTGQGPQVTCSFDGTVLALALGDGTTTLHVSATGATGVMSGTRLNFALVGEHYDLGETDCPEVRVVRVTEDDVRVHVECGDRTDPSWTHLPLWGDFTVHGCTP